MKKVVVPQAGRIMQWYVQEGEIFQPGATSGTNRAARCTGTRFLIPTGDRLEVT